MSNLQTLEEAAKYHYGSWSGDPSGNRYDAKRCAYEVYPTTGGWVPYQCHRKPGHGPAKLYCKQHAKKVSR